MDCSKDRPVLLTFTESDYYSPIDTEIKKAISMMLGNDKYVVRIVRRGKVHSRVCKQDTPCKLQHAVDIVGPVQSGNNFMLGLFY